MEKIYVTKEGYESLKSELRYLIDVERPQVLQEIKEARAQGDLSENADYDAARDKQAVIEAKIGDEIQIANDNVSYSIKIINIQ